LCVLYLRIETVIDATKEVDLEVNVRKTIFWCLVTRMEVKMRIYK
jgi:hypothetical protein